MADIPWKILDIFLAFWCGVLIVLLLSGCTCGNFTARPFCTPDKDNTLFPDDYGVWVEYEAKL